MVFGNNRKQKKHRSGQNGIVINYYHLMEIIRIGAGETENAKAGSTNIIESIPCQSEAELTDDESSGRMNIQFYWPFICFIGHEPLH